MIFEIYTTLNMLIDDDKRRLKEKIGHLDKQIMQKVDTAISEDFGLGRKE